MKVNIMKFKKLTTVAAASCFVLVAQAQQPAQFGTGTPQEVDQLQKSLQKLLVRVEASAASLNKSIGAPGTTFGTPTAYGAASGQGFVGGSGIYDFDSKGVSDGKGRVDGSMAVGIGFGDSQKGLGVELMGTLTSVNPTDGGFGDSGQVGVKVHRLLHAESGLAVAVATMDAGRWGDAKKSLRSNYIALTGNLPIKLVGNYAVSATVGVGNGNYRPLSAVNSGEDKLGAFASIGTQMTERTSVSISHLGGRTNIGFGLVPFNAPISVMVGITDIQSRTSTGKQMSVNLGYAFKF